MAPVNMTPFNIADPYTYLIVRVIYQAQQDYILKEYRAEINRFLDSNWFVHLCDSIDIIHDAIKKAIKGGEL